MFSALPIIVQCIIFCLVCVTISVALLILIRKKYNLATLKANHEVAGFTFGVIGVLYALLLAFLVIVVWEDYTDARKNCDSEANVFGNLYRDAKAFPEAYRNEVRTALINYGKLVIEEEWPIMSKGQYAYSREAWQALNKVWELYQSYNPHTEYEKIWYAESITRLNALMDYRRIRLSDSQNELHILMKIFLIAGGVITISFMYFFGVENLKAQIMMTAALSGIISFIVFLILAIDNPFQGDISIRPDSLGHIIERAKLLK